MPMAYDLVFYGYLKMEDIEEYRRLGVRCKSTKVGDIPPIYRAYLPAWVLDAKDLFDKIGGDYAGMSEKEFIAKMNPKPSRRRAARRLQRAGAGRGGAPTGAKDEH